MQTRLARMAVIASLMLMLVAAAAASSTGRPNIVVIVADDLGWNDVSFHGSNQIPTPNLDALAYNGIILNNYYVSPICTPTRGALMSGRHPIHTGLQHSVIFASQKYGLPLKEKIMPQWFKDLGYRTHMVGKWHLGFYAKQFTPVYRGFDTHYGYLLGHQDYFDHTAGCNAWHLGMFAEQYLPTRRGFESHYGYYQGCEDYYDHTYEADAEYWGLDWRRNLDVLRNETDLYSTELFTAETLSIISNHNTSEPLFLYLPHQAVHSGNTGGDPLQAPQKYVNRFKHIHNYHRRLYAGMLAALDDSVGEVVKALQSRGMMDNTVIMFTTDNGGPANGFDANAANNFPLRGVKATQWEGGVRGVGFVHSPLLKKKGYVSNQMLHVCDWLPTLYRAAGGDPSTMTNLDGYDAWEALSNMVDSPRKELLHNIDPSGKGQSGIRVGEYKLVLGDIGMSWDDWYPPWQNPEDSVKLHVKNTKKSSQDSVKQERRYLQTGAVNEFEIKGDMAVFNGDNRGEVYGNGRMDGSFSGTGSPRMESYYHKGKPVEVHCGTKPFNASTSCNPVKEPCLFHITSDPCEYNNVAAQHPDIVAQLLQRLKVYSDSMVPPLNTPVDPLGNPKYHNGTWVPWVIL